MTKYSKNNMVHEYREEIRKGESDRQRDGE